MEQFLKNFFDNNSVCIGLCDLKRKVDEIKFSYSTLTPQTENIMQTYTHIQYQPLQEKINKPYIETPAQVQQTIKQKPQKQTLAQIFAEQQRAYAEQQAIIKRQNLAQAQQQIQYRQKLQQQVNNADAKVLFTNKNPYAPQSAIPQNPQSKVIVNGNMKKVVSSAVPVQRYM